MLLASPQHCSPMVRGRMSTTQTARVPVPGRLIEKHLRRQLTMAIVARKTNNTYLVEAVHRALGFFLEKSAPNGTTFPFGEIHSTN